MKRIITLTEQEVELLKNTLTELIAPVNGEVKVGSPYKYRQWVESPNLGREEWENISYPIQITSLQGNYNTSFGLATREGAEGDIKAHALSIAMQFCHTIDPDSRSVLAKQLWK